MLLALGATAIVAAVLLWELALPRVRAELPRMGNTIARHRVRRRAPQVSYDPGRELRAEQRARELLRSCVNEEEWAMYRDLGFLRVWSPQGGGEHPSRGAAGGREAGGKGARSGEAGGKGARGGEAGDTWSGGVSAVGGREGRDERSPHGAGAPYAYLLYPHRPIVAYVPRTGALLNEYCVAFPDDTRPYGSARLPDADDVLAKWMALTADERRLIADANMHLPGRQVDPEQVHEDLARLARWERERAGQVERGQAERGKVERGLGGVRAA